jgi:formylglycine-generating enzyme required for sulfatase activity
LDQVISRRALLSAAMLVPARAWGRTQTDAYRGARPGAARLIAGVPFCWCPPGRFTMGSPPEEAGRRPDEAQADVQLTRGFWTSKFEVTQGQWRAQVGDFPDRPPTAEFGLGDNHPVYWVSYIDAGHFCARLTARAHDLGALPETWEIRLPTEAQWEYACRAGTTTATAFGEQLRREDANFDAAARADSRRPSASLHADPVGSYRANRWGLCDMHGNIFEWCRDWYHAQLPGGVDPDLSERPGVQNRDGTYSRCRRGGAWNDPALFCRSALRLRFEPERRSDHIGFRVVAVEGTPS